MDDFGTYILDEDDIAFEYELQKNPENVLSWSRYVEHWKTQNKEDSAKRPIVHIIWLYNRYIQQFMNNIEIWDEYLTWLIQINTVTNGANTKLILQLHDICIQSVMDKDSERICTQYLKLAIDSYDLESIRKALDLSLQRVKNKAKHAELWESVITFLQDKFIPVTLALNEDDQDKNDDNDDDSQLETLELIFYKKFFGVKKVVKDENAINIWASQILERYLIVCPKDKINDILLLLSKTNDYIRIKSCFDKYLINKQGSNHHIPFSLYFIYLTCLNDLSISDKYKDLFLDLQKKYPDEKVKLTIYDINNQIESSEYKPIHDRIINEIEQTIKTSDFVILYNYYLDFELAIINVVSKEWQYINDKKKWNEVLKSHVETLGQVIERRELFVNDLRIRKNPNVIPTWRDRIKLMDKIKGNAGITSTFANAMKQIDAFKVQTPGEFGTFWCDYAYHFWNKGDYDVSREVYELAIKVPFPNLKDLETIYLHWIDHECELNEEERGLNMYSEIMKVPSNYESLIQRYDSDKRVPANTVLFNSFELWTRYIFLLESQPDTKRDTSKIIDSYEQMIKLKLITPSKIGEYATFFSKIKKPLESCKIYERSIDMFPQVEAKLGLWLMYLNFVVDDIKEMTMNKEVIRDLFENAISSLEEQDEINIAELYFLYNRFEEKIQRQTETVVSKRSIDILLNGARQLNDKFMKSKIALWDLALEKTKTLLGPVATRPIYEECIEKVTPDAECVKYVLGYAIVERELGEWKRVRELLRYGANLIAPRHNEPLWTFWNEFELAQGDKNLYKEMLLLKKTLERTMVVDTEEITKQEGHIQFVAAKGKSKNNNNTAPTNNPEEIDLDI